MDRGAWWATVQGVRKSWTQLKRPSTHTCSRVSYLTSLCLNFPLWKMRRKIPMSWVL